MSNQINSTQSPLTLLRFLIISRILTVGRFRQNKEMHGTSRVTMLVLPSPSGPGLEQSMRFLCEVHESLHKAGTIVKHLPIIPKKVHSLHSIFQRVLSPGSWLTLSSTLVRKQPAGGLNVLSESPKLVCTKVQL